MRRPRAALFGRAEYEDQELPYADEDIFVTRRVDVLSAGVDIDDLEGWVHGRYLELA